MEFIATSSCSRVLNTTSQFSCLPSPNIQNPPLLTPSISSLRFSPRREFSCNSTLSTSVSTPKIVATDFELSNLTALSPLDGRYWNKVKDLSPHLSEYGLIYYRVLVEVKWLIKLSEISEIAEVPRFSKEAQAYLEALIDGFSMEDALEVKNIEKVTNHDVKAVEYFLKKKCQPHPEIAKVLEFFHFACTSEDINNLAHALMLKESMNKVVFPTMDDLIKAICNMAVDYASIPMLSRTHGQVKKSCILVGIMN